MSRITTKWTIHWLSCWYLLALYSLAMHLRPCLKDATQPTPTTTATDMAKLSERIWTSLRTWNNSTFAKWPKRSESAQIFVDLKTKASTTNFGLATSRTYTMLNAAADTSISEHLSRVLIWTLHISHKHNFNHQNVEPKVWINKAQLTSFKQILFISSLMHWLWQCKYSIVSMQN